MKPVVLTVNTGSSSVRLAAFAPEGGSLSLLASGHFPGEWSNPAVMLHAFLTGHGIEAVAAVAHRIVHGGARLTAPCSIDAEVEAEIERLAPLAPLHNPRALEWIRASRALAGAEATQVAVFDTAFYAALPEAAATYALPRALCARHGIRRYGFHGLAHQAMWRRWCDLRPEPGTGGRVISLQLGAGCSITAIRDGQAVDTSMGFSPLEGLVMATRSGDVDPGVLLFLQKAEGLAPERMERLFNEEAGLLGLSGTTGDMRRLIDSAAPAATLAVDVYCYRARKYIGAYLAALGGADAILFGGGVGEQAPEVRARILTGLEGLGIVPDADANRAAIGAERCISRRGSATEVWVIPVDEAAILAQAALAVMAPPEAIRVQEERS
ncbi:MAG: acetate/propionate family kinase [Thiobacillus sp.]|uniref:acetate/propionate family kinase n=1 Tax=Thiobacillus sp. TaxID=924 RepID=UPI002893BACB|nr:acetate/propionate family kinase [Thiobacillus sp.]MDT3706236.1 acetate/propionate family kinase [Thiobacillus sp.]